MAINLDKKKSQYSPLYGLLKASVDSALLMFSLGSADLMVNGQGRDLSQEEVVGVVVFAILRFLYNFIKQKFFKAEGS